MRKASGIDGNRQNNIRIMKRNLATAKAVLLFWDSSFWRLIYNRVLKHKFPPLEVLARYEMRAERRIYRVE